MQHIFFTKRIFYEDYEDKMPGMLEGQGNSRE